MFPTPKMKLWKIIRWLVGFADPNTFFGLGKSLKVSENTREKNSNSDSDTLPFTITDSTNFIKLNNPDPDPDHCYIVKEPDQCWELYIIYLHTIYYVLLFW